MLRKLTGGFLLLCVILNLVEISRTAENDFCDAWITSVGPDRGSLWGETMITLKGGKFAENQFDYGEGMDHLGNKVNLVADLTSYPCRIHKDGCSETQITCYTPKKMPEAEYTVQVKIDGKKIRPENYCAKDATKCKFKPDSSHTPTFSSVAPLSGKTGQMITVTGKIFTDLFGSNVIKSSNDKTAKFLRNYVGSHPCELKDFANDKLYGIRLNNGGASDWGDFDCKLVTRDVGFLNCSFIINEKYGRSKPDLKALRVASNGKIYMLQSYAWILDVNPKKGSINGGTTITITGGNFDDTSGQPKVMIAGTSCDIIGKIEIDKIICKTKSKPATTGPFEGGRGMNIGWWNETMVELDKFDDLDTEASDYSSWTIDRTHYYDDTGTDNFNLHAWALYVAPQTSQYRFYVQGDDDIKLFLSTDEKAANKVEIAKVTVKSSYFGVTTQGSNPISLEKNKRYYMEIRMREGSERAFFKVASFAAKSHVNPQMTGAAWHEIQELIFSSDVEQEIQQLETTKPDPETKVNEIQTVDVVGADDIKFRLGFFDMYTVALTTASSADDVAKALKQLPILADGDVTVSATTSSGGSKWEITFDSDAGDFPDLEYKWVDSDAIGNNPTITVEEKTKGVSSLTSFSLQMGNSPPSPLITVDANKAEVKEKLLQLFSVRCPSAIWNPSNTGYSQDFEESTWSKLGTRVSDEDPYCGRFSSLDPEYLWKKAGDSDKRGLALATYKFFCFAYRGSKKHLKMKFTSEHSEKGKRTTWRDFFTTDEDERDKSDPPKWHYQCENMLEVATAARPDDDDFLLEYVKMYKFHDSEDVYVDTINIARDIATDIEGHDDRKIAQVKPGGTHVRDVFVEKNGLVYTIKIDPHDCGINFPLFSTAFATMFTHSAIQSLRRILAKDKGTLKTGTNKYRISNNNKDLDFTFSRTTAATPPITKTYKLSFKNVQTEPINAFEEEKNLKKSLEILGNMGDIKVVRKGDCANHNYTVTWLTLPGDQEELEIESKLEGNNVEANVSTEQDGGLWQDVIEGDSLRTLWKKPQVSVMVNDVPSACEGDCAFEWSDDATPTATAVTLTGGTRKKRAVPSGPPGTSITITGSGFSTTLAQNKVTISGITCTVTAATGTSITCTVGYVAKGTYQVVVNVVGKGTATSAGQFTFLTAVTGISPSTGGTAGGTHLTINGYGFGASSTVEVGGQTCQIDTIDTAMIKCFTPPATSSSVTDVPVQVTQGGVSTVAVQTFAYDHASTPVITQISATESSVTDGATFTITGTKFGADPAPEKTLWVCKTSVDVSSYTDTQIVGTFPPHGPETCDVTLRVGNIGRADTSQISKVTYKLKVTNVHPQQGSVSGGTRVTITGEGFAKDKTNATFGSHVCNIDSLTETQIVCTIAHTGKLHTVDNSGTNQEYGVGYAWNPISLDIETGDRVQFKWMTPEDVTGINYMVREVSNAISTEGKPGGFKSGLTGTPSGVFTHYFSVPRKYFYTSGPVNVKGDVSFGGVIIAKDKESFVEVLMLKVDDFEAVYDDSGSNPSDSSSCPGTIDKIAGCQDPLPADKDASKFNFKFWTCMSSKITGISTNVGTTTQVITIDGEGLSSTPCENEIVIGAAKGIPTEASTTQVKFTIDPSNQPPVGQNDFVMLCVNNRGCAMGGKNLRFTLIPGITDMSPKSGSQAGGTVLTITGTGFVEDGTTVVMEGYACVIKSLSYTQIICVTQGTTTGEKAVKVTSTVGANDLIGEWPAAGDNIFTYDQPKTPTLASVAPEEVSGAKTTLTATGTRFGTVLSDVTVKVGESTCTVTAVTETSVTCDVGDIPVGSHDVRIHVAGMGNAKADTPVKVESSKVITSIDPVSGSIHGCQTVTITGNGFVDNDTSVTFGGKDCAVVNVIPSEIKCTTPAHAVAAVDVVVVSNSKTYPSISYDFSQDMTPVLNSLSPDSGIEGDSVTAAGTGFKASGNYFMVNGAEFQSSTASETLATFTLLNEPTRAYTVQIKVPGKGCTGSKPFKYNVGITDISPATGTSGGETVVTITGQGIVTKNTTVTICDETCTFVDVPEQSSSTYICLTPVPATTVTTTQVCDVVIKVNDVSATKAGAFTYDRSITPEITDVTPTRGGTGGGTKVTITGTGFGTDASVVKVTIGGTICPVFGAVTAEKIICETNESKSKRTTVKVNINKRGSALQNNANFWYIDVWSSKFTWDGKDPPVKGDFVVVPKGQILLLDTDVPVLKMLLIKGGELIFDEKDITLKAENILITDQGKFQVGTEEKPFQHKAIIELHGHLRSKELPIYGTKTLALREGVLDLHGKRQSVMWTRLENPAAVGATSITVQDAVDWVAGDKVVIATTGDRHSQKETEVRKLTEVSADKKTLSFTEPLLYKHLGETLHFTGTTKKLEARAEVGLLTQNVVVRGSKDVQWNDKIEACPDGFDTGEFATQTCFQGRFGDELGSDQFGSQIMVHAPRPNENLVQARLSHIETTHAGQAFRLGRYAIHFHLNGDMSNSYVKHCSIHNTFNRAVNIHGTHNTLVKDNVAYDIHGGAFFLEDGVETNNTFDHNLAVFVTASTSLLNDDITPAAFWITNPDNHVINNAVAGGTHFGIWYRMHEFPDGPSATTSIRCKRVKMGTNKDNVVHSLGWFGIWVFEDYFPDPETGPAHFDGLISYLNEKGLEAVRLGNLQFKNLVLVANDKAGIELKQLTNFIKYDTERGPLIKDSLIVSHHPSLLQETAIAIVVPWENGLIIDNVEFVNFDKPGKGERATLAVSVMQGTCGDLCGGYTVWVRNLKFHNSDQKIMFHWQHEAVFRDLDGSLTGKTSNSSVLPKTGILDPAKCVDAGTGFNVSGIQASICDPSVTFHRFSSNKPIPESNLGKDQIFENEHGTAIAKFTDKRVTHKNGWMIVLPGGLTYNMAHENAEHVANISYSGIMHSFTDESDFVILSQNASELPDKFSMGGKDIKMSKEPLDNSKHFNGDWYYDSTKGKISYLVSGRMPLGSSTDSDERNVDIKVVKCFYKGCKRPPNIKEIMEQPDPVDLYSNLDTWKHLGRMPKENDELVIPEDKWVLLDKQPPKLKKLTIHGALQFPKGSKWVLSADCIIVYGRLVIGWPDDPFTGLATIILTGSHDTEECSAGDGPNIGSAALAVYGRLDINGKDTSGGIPWTHLAVNAMKDTDTLTLTEDVAWPEGDEILITTTSYSAWHTEIFKIKSVTGKTVKLNGTLKYTHSVVNDDKIGVVLSAKVAHLTRNVKIKGGSEATMFKQSFGARVLVASTSINETIRHVGIAAISRAEFVHTGQEGYTTSFDPRYSLAFVHADTKSTVEYSTFHHGFAPAIGVYGVKDMVIKENVVHHTVGSAIIADGVHTTLRRNLIVLVIWSGTYNGRDENKNVRWPSGVDLREAKDAVIIDNVVAGSERAAFRVIGELCTGDSAWSGNQAQSSLAGLVAFDSEDTLINKECVRFANFVLWRNAHYGIYYTYDATVEVVDCYFIENGLGLYTMVIGPSATAHQIGDEYAAVRNSVFVGQTSDFDCSYHKIDGTDKNIQYSEQAFGFVRKDGVGMVGVSLTTFSQGSNSSPRKPWTNIMAYMTIAGLMELTGVKFLYYGRWCGSSNGRNYAMTTNGDNDDMNYDVRVSGLTKFQVDIDSLLFIHRPDLGKINPSDCVDMDCDGKKKFVIHDTDGTLLGTTGTVVPHSEWEWGGDRRRGLGDYRVPRQMLVDSDGKRIAVPSKKGIVRNDQCTLRNAWHAYECHNIDHRMLVVENMDVDTELRRLSPVAVLINGYLDLGNGPQDHGWCAGYTCQKRLSTFHFVVQNGQVVKVYFTSTSPQTTRLMLLNSNDSVKVVVAVWYARRMRLDVYVNKVYILPKNGNMKGKTFTYKNMDIAACLPSTSDAIRGANCNDETKGLFYVLLIGSIPVEIRTTKMVVVDLTFMTVDEFFGDEIIKHLAAFLGVDPSKIRIVKIIRATRRKRDALVVTEVTAECGDPPNTPATEAMTQQQLEDAEADINNGALLGNLPIGPNGINPTGVILQGPLPDVNTAAWGNMEQDAQPYTISKAGRMTFHEPAVPGREGQEFITPIRLRIYDDSGAAINNVGTIAKPWQVEATLTKGPGSHTSAVLGGTTVQNFTGGWANFTDLHISHLGEDYTIEFKVIYPVSNFTEETPAMIILKRDLEALMVNKTSVIMEDAPMTLTLGLRDRNTNLPVSDINWRGHTWAVTASTSEGTLTGTKTANFDLTTGHATFTDLQLDEVGRYYINFTIVSTPLDYAFIHEMYFDVTNQALEDAPKDKTTTCQFKFDTEYHVHRSPRDVARFARKWAIKNKANGIKVLDSTAAEGSVLATLIIEGSTSGVDRVIADLCKEVKGSERYEFNGQMIPMEPYMKVDGEKTCGPESGHKPGLHPGIIAAIVIAVLLVIVVIVILIVWRCVIVPKNKTYDTNRDLRSLAKGNGKYTIEDYLFRDKTFNSIKSQAPTPAAPADTTGKTFSLNVDSRLDMYDDRPASTASGRSLPPKMPLPSD